MKKKILSIVLGCMMVAGMTACGSTGTPAETAPAGSADTAATADAATSSAAENTDAAASGDFDPTMMISIFSREDGSGTRGAFVELFGIEQKDENGDKVDYTTEDANITNNTSVMMTSVASNEYAIGYISLGSLDDSVKAIQIDGVDPTVENIKAGTYTIARPFNIATKGELSEVAQDFENYIMSADGQAVIDENGYISNDGAEAFAGTNPSGKVVVAGSSSVSPVMEKLKEAYLAVNPNAEIEIQTSDSTTGMSAAAEGICDIGMASRELKDSETSAGLTATTIAMDGIAVIVNNGSPVQNLTKDQVCGIYTGQYFFWNEVTE